MAAFDKNHTVLNFGVPRQSAGIQYLMWPVLGYRIIAPVARAKQKANLIETALLGLVRAGVGDALVISRLLGIGHELVLHISAKLMSGFQPALDSRFRLTEFGRRILEDSDVETRVQKTGWIFQDPWTGEVWSRFVTDLPTVVVSGDRNGFPEIDLGTEGKPFTTVPMLIAPRFVQASPPRPEEILCSVRLIEAVAKTGALDDESLIPYLKGDLGKISYLDAEPEPMYCLTAMVTDASRGVSNAWSIRDPFLPKKDSIRLHRALALRLVDYPAIARRLATMLGIDASQNSETLSEVLLRADVSAEMEIKARFGRLAEEFGLLDRLVELEKKRQLMTAMGLHADLEQVLLACGKVTERLMKQVLRKYSLPSLAKTLELARGKKCFKLLGQDTEQSLTVLGFIEVPRTLLSIDQGKLNHALIKAEGTLMPLTLACALIALVSESHPLKTLGKLQPDLLERIGAISAGRNPGAHDNESSQTALIDVDHVQKLVEDTFSLSESVLRVMRELEQTAAKGEKW